MDQLDLLSPFLGQNWHHGEDRLGLTFRWTGPGPVASVMWGSGLRDEDELVIEIPAFCLDRTVGNLRLVVDGVLQSFSPLQLGRQVELRSTLRGLAPCPRSSILLVVDHLEVENGRPIGVAVSRIVVRRADDAPDAPRGLEDDLMRRWCASTTLEGEFLNWRVERESVLIDGSVQQATLAGLSPIGFIGRLFRSTGKLTFEFFWPPPESTRLLVRLDNMGMTIVEATGEARRLPSIAVSELLASVARLIRAARIHGPDEAREFAGLNDLAVELFRHVASAAAAPLSETRGLRVPGSARMNGEKQLAGLLEWVNIKEQPQANYYHIDVALMHESGRLNFLAQHQHGQIGLSIIEDSWSFYRPNGAMAPLPLTIAKQSSIQDQRSAWATFSAATREGIRLALLMPQLKEELVGKLGRRDPRHWLELLTGVNRWLADTC